MYTLSTLSVTLNVSISSVSVSMVEVYNDNIIDLLEDNNNKSAQNDNKKIRVRKTSKGTEITGVNSIEVSNSCDVLATFSKGKKARSVASTKMNIQSSRSHMILWVTLHAFNTMNGLCFTYEIYLNFYISFNDYYFFRS